MSPKPSEKSPAFISHSDALETDYAVFVEAPQGREPCPAVVFLDGDYIFDIAAKTYRTLRKQGLIAPAAIVAVGYGHSFNEPGNHRGRDYTPSASPEEPESGGADAFLGHLTGSLWPELARRYPLREDQRIIAGHSLGGLFALHALFQAKPFFKGALIGAPSIWWDRRNFLGYLAKLRSQKPVLPARLFLGIGEEDTVSMREDFDLLVAQLDGNRFQGLELIPRKFSKRNHYDVAPLLIAEGLRALLPP
jgi:predicted alpha/beta superfamily hydrolase